MYLGLKIYHGNALIVYLFPGSALDEKKWSGTKGDAEPLLLPIMESRNSVVNQSRAFKNRNVYHDTADCFERAVYRACYCRWETPQIYV